MFSVIANVVAAAGSPASVMQDQFRESLVEVYQSNAHVTNMGLTHREQANEGSTNVTFTIRGRGTTPGTRGTKADGDLPNQGSMASYNIPSTYDEPEYLDMPYSLTKYGDTRFKVAGADARIEVINAIQDDEKRLLATFWKTAQLGALAGFLPAPTIAKRTGAGAQDVNDAGAFPLSDVGAERGLLYMTQLQTTMTNGDNKKAANWVWIVRSDFWQIFKFGTRTASMFYNSGADLRKGMVSELDGIQIKVVPTQFWPQTNYVDKSFNKYNTDARYNSANGTPVAFLVNYDAENSPIGEATPPTEAGISVKLLNDDAREVMYCRVKSRGGYDSYRRDLIGAVSFAA